MPAETNKVKKVERKPGTLRTAIYKAVKKIGVSDTSPIISKKNTTVVRVRPRMFENNSEQRYINIGLKVKFGPTTADIYLGGKKNLPVNSLLETEQDYIKLIRKGITKKSIDFLMEAADIPAVEMAEIMEITPRKLAAIKPDTLMEKSQSEKAVNIARLYALGEEVFGSKEEFNKWMNGRVPSLGKKRPKEYLDTSSGINLLMEEICRIQHGVYS